MSLKANLQAVNQLLQKNDIVVIHVPNKTTIQTYFNLLIFWQIRVPKAIFLANIKIGTQEVVEQFNIGVNAHDVKVDIRLSTIKPLQAKWVVIQFLIHNLVLFSKVIFDNFINSSEHEQKWKFKN